MKSVLPCAHSQGRMAYGEFLQDAVAYQYIAYRIAYGILDKHTSVLSLPVFSRIHLLATVITQHALVTALYLRQGCSPANCTRRPECMRASRSADVQVTLVRTAATWPAVLTPPERQTPRSQLLRNVFLIVCRRCLLEPARPSS